MTTTLSTKRGVGYFRVSGPGQTGERHSSLETQEARFLDYCQRLELSPITTFVDVLSGRKDDRGGYRSMVEYVLQGGAEVVVVQFLDRFGRNPREILQRYWELGDHGVEVVATDEDIKEELLLLIKAGIAGAESRRISERVRANMSRAVLKGVHAARAPYGLRRVYEGRDLKWEIDPVEGPVLRKMYTLTVVDNLGFKGVADRLTEEGYRARSGGPFSSETIRKVLRNEAIKGTLTYGKRPRKGNPQQDVVRVEGFFPAILTKDEWDKLQERLSIRRESSRGRTHSSSYLLSGIARCDYCGGPMVGKVGAKRKRGRYRNYWCSRAIRGRGLCTKYNGHSAPKLESAVLEYLGQFSDPEKVRQHMATAERKDLADKRAELEAVNRGLSEVDSQFMQHLDLLKRAVLNEEEFVKANEGLRGQKAAFEGKKLDLEAWLTEQTDQVSAADRMPTAIRSFLVDFSKTEARIQKAHLQTILKAVHVHRERIEVEFRV